MEIMNNTKDNKQSLFLSRKVRSIGVQVCRHVVWCASWKIIINLWAFKNKNEISLKISTRQKQASDHIETDRIMTPMNEIEIFLSETKQNYPENK